MLPRTPKRGVTPLRARLTPHPAHHRHSNIMPRVRARRAGARPRLRPPYRDNSHRYESRSLAAATRSNLESCLGLALGPGGSPRVQVGEVTHHCWNSLGRRGRCVVVTRLGWPKGRRRKCEAVPARVLWKARAAMGVPTGVGIRRRRRRQRGCVGVGVGACESRRALRECAKVTRPRQTHTLGMPPSHLSEANTDRGERHLPPDSNSPVAGELYKSVQ